MKIRALAPDQTVQSVLPGIVLARPHVLKGVDPSLRLTIHPLFIKASRFAVDTVGGVTNELIQSSEFAFTPSDGLTSPS